MMEHSSQAGQTVPASDERRLRVLHALAVSAPHLNGYAVRSRYIVETQQRSGHVRPAVITSPFYPGLAAAKVNQILGDVEYVRVPHPVDDVGGSLGDRLARLLYRLRRTPVIVVGRSQTRRLRRGIALADGGHVQGLQPGEGLPGGTASRQRPSHLRRVAKRLVFAVARPMFQLGDRFAAVSWWSQALEALEERLLMRRFALEIAANALRLRADLIHAHSPYRTALPAIAAAHSLGLPVVYELRGLWEESAVASGYFRSGDRRYRAWRRKEERAMAAADAVVCIGEELRREVVARGLPAERVFVVPNAVDANAFRPPAQGVRRPADVAAVKARLVGTTFGYVGSVRKLEGVDELVRAVAELVRRGRDVSLLVVGGGEVQGLRVLADELALGPRAVLTGAVPHEEVAAYYRLIDVFVISRPDLPVTRLVTPLKPLEAMALERPLIVSDLPALRELVHDGKTGLVYRPGDVAQLAEVGERLIDDPALRRCLGQAGRRWVEEERTWERVLARLPDIYAAASQSAKRRRRVGS
jgi:glycosyltransferase involved in cell wall biosynthesis